MKVENIKIEEDLARFVWARGAKSPPRKIRVRMNKTDEGYVLVSRYDEDAEAEIPLEKDTKKIETKIDTAKEAPAKEAPAKEAPAKEAPAKEAPAKDKK